MNRRRYLQVLGLVAGGGWLASTAGEVDAPPAHGRYHNPVYEQRFADPAIIRDQTGIYYACSTRMLWEVATKEFVRHDVPLLRSADLINWEYVDEVFDDVPQWNPNGDGIWAPDIVKWGDEYRVYYSLYTYGDPWDVSIGVATADHPAGPFDDKGSVVTSRESGVKDSIDPQVFIDDDGTPYLVWGGHVAGIHVAEMDAEGRRLVEEPTFIAGTEVGSSVKPGFEGAYLIKREGYYYLFVSSGGCCSGKNSTYETEVGRAKSVKGPYLNEKGQEIKGTHGKLVLASSDAFHAPGHNSITTDDAGRDWILYHAYERGEWTLSAPYDGANRRVLLIDPIRWVNGWPEVEDDRPSTVQNRPTIKGNKAAGSSEFPVAE